MVEARMFKEYLLNNVMVKKDTPRIINNDIYTAVAKRTSLTKEQIQECFKAYSEIVLEFAEVSNKPLDFAISLPYIGYLQYQRYHNNKTKVSGALRYFTDGANVVDADLSKFKTNKEWDRLTFSVQPAIQRRIKEKSLEMIAQAQKSKELTERDFSNEQKE